MGGWIRVAVVAGCCGPWTSAFAQDALVEGDFDCDGRIDVASATAADGRVPATIEIAYGVSTGGKTSVLEAGVPEVLMLSVTDVDADGCDDLSVAGRDTGISTLFGGESGERLGQSLLPEIDADGRVLDTVITLEPSSDGFAIQRLSAGGGLGGLGGFGDLVVEETWTCTRTCYDFFGIPICVTCCSGERDGTPWGPICN